MQVEITAGPAFALGTVNIGPGTEVKVEAGAMAAMTGDVQIETKATGGLLGGLKRSVLGAEGLVTRFTGPGTVWLQTRSPQDLLGWLTANMPGNRS